MDRFRNIVLAIIRMYSGKATIRTFQGHSSELEGFKVNAVVYTNEQGRAKGVVHFVFNANETLK